jgi:TRAP-type mannitol/chloroaromatic compound transport system substrate-binding protein
MIGNSNNAVDAASRDTFTWISGRYDAVNAPALKRLIANGAILRGFPQEVLEACYTTANVIYADLAKTNPHFGKMHASMMAFRNDSLP